MLHLRLLIECTDLSVIMIYIGQELGPYVLKCSSVSSSFCGAALTQKPVLSGLELHVSVRLYGKAMVTESVHS
jgi:hypothetical protein